MKYRYRSEEEMKDSGVEWIGYIPKNWSVSRIDKEFIVRNEKVSDKEFPPLSVTKQGILPQLENVAKSDNSDNRKKVCIGDFVINSRADRKGSCGVSSYDGSVSLICNVLTPKYLESQYVHSLFRNYYFSEEFYRWGSGIVDDLWSTNVERMKKINIPIPHENEDGKIANFLDEKTAQFDSIISKKEVLIQRLEEAKKSLISEVVTGKVKVVKTSDGYELVERKKEEMKDSGVEYLKNIPNNWETKAIKYLFQLRNERNIKEMSEVQLLSLFTSLGVMKQGEVEARGNKVRTVEDYKEVYPNDIVVNIILAWMGAIGMSEYRGVISPAYDIYKPINSYVNSKYYHYLFRTSRFSGECYKKGRGIMEMRWRTYSDEFKSIIAPDPSVEEQGIIVGFLDERITSIDQLVERTNKQIAKLKQAKQSLISEAVTGKIEILD